jgi:hypothetical protein
MFWLPVRIGAPILTIALAAALGCAPPARVNTDGAAGPAAVGGADENPPLIDPPVLLSAGGKLTVELEAASGAFEIAGQRYDGMLYNGA